MSKMFLQLWTIVCFVPLVLGNELFDLKNDTCGGIISNSKETITLEADTNTSCTWHFTSNTTRRYFTFTSFALGPGDYILLYDKESGVSNGSAVDQLVGNFTGKLDPFVAVTFTNVSTLTYHRAVNQSKSSNFTLQFNTNTCHVPIKSSGGTVHSPYFFPSPQETLRCSYSIQTNSADSNVGLTFDKVNLAKGDVIVRADNATGTVLLNTTGPATTLGDVISPGQSLYLETVLPTVRADNFSATFFTPFHECSKGFILLTAPTNLTSPEYPKNYPNYVDCRYVIKAPEGMTIEVQVLDLDLADNVDEITVTDGDNKASTVLMSLNSGFKQNGLLLTSGNTMWLRMRTDESQTGRGFNLLLTPKVYGGAGRGQGRISILPPPVTNTDLSADNSTDTDIYFVLYANSGMQVSISLNQSEWSPTASIEFRDGTNVNGTLLGYWDSQDNPAYTVVSSGEVMLVIAHGFMQPATPALRTFVADFTSVKPGVQQSMSADSGSVTLRESAISQSATYIILNRGDKSMVALDIEELYVPVNATFTVYQDVSGQSGRMINFTTAAGEQGSKSVPVIYTKQARIEFRFLSKPTVDKDQILLRFSYRMIQGCGQFNLSKSAGALESPLYPNLYPANALCQWSFIPTLNKSLRLSFSDVSLGGHDSVTIEADHHHMVTISNKTTVNITREVLQVLTNKSSGLDDMIVPMHTSGLNTTLVTVTFNSSTAGHKPEADLDVASGFQINYEHLACGGNITDPSQPISTPGYPSAVSGAPVRCVWEISLPQPADNTSTSIAILDLEIHHYQPNTNTTTATLEIRDGGSSGSDLIPIAMKDGKIPTIWSRVSRVWILYTFTTTDKKGTGFGFTVSFQNHVCAKKDQCDNGVCMHPDWKCNGHDECGDDSDERDCIHTTRTISGVALGMSILVTFIVATVLACTVPACYKRLKYPNYSELRDLMTPVPT